MHKKQFFIFCCLICYTLTSQVSQSIIIDKVNTKNLTNPFVSSLFQDLKGYLWIGTTGGLNKYDGYEFTKFRNTAKDSTSLSNSSITGFHQTEIDYIFIGTRNGLNIYNYNDNKFTRVFYDSKEINDFKKNNIYCVVTNKGGEKIIG